MRIGIIIILLCSIPFAWAQEKIVAIEVTGLKRTRESTVREIIKVEEGDEIDNDFARTVEQRLRKTGLFQDDISVELRPGPEGETLRIAAKDRWTLVGMPFFSMNNGNMGGGFFAYESNLFGTRKVLVTSLSAGEKTGVNGLVVYQDPSLGESDFNISLASSAGRETIRYANLSGEEEWDSFIRNELAFSAGLGYGFSDDYSLTGTILGFHRGYGESKDTCNLLGLSCQTGYDGRYYHDLFASGAAVSLNGQTLWQVPGSLALFAKAHGSYGFVIGENILIQGSFDGGLTDAPDTSLYRLGGVSGSRSLPAGSIGSDRYAAGELLGEVRIIRMSWGSLTLPVFYEGGLLRDFRNDNKAYHGMGGGLRLYLSKVSIPALGLDFTYNFTTETPGLSFFLGMSF